MAALSCDGSRVSLLRSESHQHGLLQLPWLSTPEERDMFDGT